MTEHPRIRAVLAGLGTLGLVTAEGGLLAMVVFVLLLSTDPRLAAGAYRGATEVVVGLLWGFALLAGGYVAASRVERQKAHVGLLLGAVVLIFSLGLGAGLALLSGGVSSWGRAAGYLLDYLGGLLLPALGGLLQARRGDKGRPVYPLRLFGLVIAYDIFLIGLLLTAGALLLVGYYPGKTAPFARWQLWLFAALPLLLSAYGGLLLRNHGGLRRRLLKQPVAWACVAAVGWFVFCFMRDERANRADVTGLGRMIEQINAANDIPADKNGAALVDRAYDILRKAHEPRGDEPTGVWDPKQHPAWAAYLDEAAPALALARQAAGMPVFYRIEYADGPDKTGTVDSSVLNRVRNLARTLDLEAMRADVGFGDSLELLDAAVRLSAPMRKRGDFSALLAGGMAGMVNGTVRDLLLAKRPDAAQLQRTDRLLTIWEALERPDPAAECLAVRLNTAEVHSRVV